MAPPEDWLKINVDGALDERTGEGGIGVVIRNHRGELFSRHGGSHWAKGVRKR
jgi:ribonuclease HI